MSPPQAVSELRLSCSSSAAVRFFQHQASDPFWPRSSVAVADPHCHTEERLQGGGDEGLVVL